MTIILQGAFKMMLVAGLLFAGSSTAQDAPANQTPEGESLSSNYYEISTRHGNMVILLYDDTPGHRDNFAKLVSDGFYDGTTFHRVISNFMIQGGDPNTKGDDPMLFGQGGPGYTIPAEINAAHFHKRGAVAAARQADQVNPKRASSGSQFYLVHGGEPFEDAVLTQVEYRTRKSLQDPEFTFTPEMRDAYQKGGGAPHLDGMYTIFGEVVEGFDVLDLIGAEATARSTGEQTQPAMTDQPIESISMEIRQLSDYTPPTINE
jgi:cyclophilin family peptidyl-prolyl cis-trans isomerase